MKRSKKEAAKEGAKVVDETAAKVEAKVEKAVTETTEKANVEETTAKVQKAVAETAKAKKAVAETAKEQKTVVETAKAQKAVAETSKKPKAVTISGDKPKLGARIKRCFKTIFTCCGLFEKQIDKLSEKGRKYNLRRKQGLHRSLSSRSRRQRRRRQPGGVVCRGQCIIRVPSRIPIVVRARTLPRVRPTIPSSLPPRRRGPNAAPRALLKLKESDVVRHVGVSNLNAAQLERVAAVARPACLQVELHALCQQPALLAAAQRLAHRAPRRLLTARLQSIG
ncbi:hypothetical protein PYW08_007550 [Mythimna loreyi]|uniref:Uncharacterized protein n=1 Tax=Mythimna loreyi TaxID=667449 RepID=A0ACC2QCJ4_9NEOP|nr:hypothetical protein PYW08_007550 [Mythimna loreyi]